jgi:hypothetical protein
MVSVYLGLSGDWRETVEVSNNCDTMIKMTSGMRRGEGIRKVQFSPLQFCFLYSPVEFSGHLHRGSLIVGRRDELEVQLRPINFPLWVDLCANFGRTSRFSVAGCGPTGEVLR